MNVNFYTIIVWILDTPLNVSMLIFDFLKFRIFLCVYLKHIMRTHVSLGFCVVLCNFTPSSTFIIYYVQVMILFIYFVSGFSWINRKQWPIQISSIGEQSLKKLLDYRLHYSDYFVASTLLTLISAALCMYTLFPC